VRAFQQAVIHTVVIHNIHVVFASQRVDAVARRDDCRAGGRDIRLEHRGWPGLDIHSGAAAAEACNRADIEKRRPVVELSLVVCPGHAANVGANGDRAFRVRGRVQCEVGIGIRNGEGEPRILRIEVHPLRRSSAGILVLNPEGVDTGRQLWRCQADQSGLGTSLAFSFLRDINWDNVGIGTPQ